MRLNKMVGLELRNLSILISRYIIKKDREAGCYGDCKNHKPTHLQIHVMEYLYDNRNKDIFQKNLERDFSIRRPTATSMLQRMERDGLIKRIAVPNDGRLKKIVITDKAQEHFEMMRAKATEFEKTLTNGLTDDEIATFVKTIQKIKNNLEINHTDDV